MSKFTTPVSMKVTEEQFEKDLRTPLEKMGYRMYYSWWDDCNYFMTSSDKSGKMYPNQDNAVLSGVHYIDHYNPELFLALAAMTNEEYGIAGEWWVNTICVSNFSIDKLYQSAKPLNQSLALFDNNKRRNGFYLDNLKFFRKATKEEIINHLTKQKNMKSVSRIVSPKNAKRILDAACIGWKKKLASMWGADILLEKDIIVSEDFYSEMREACTTEQNKLFDEIFGIEEEWFPGELYWIKKSVTDNIWDLRYASCEIGAFYVDQRKQGDIQYWSTYQLAKGIKLPD